MQKKLQKKRGTDALHGRSPARYYEKKVLFHELANDDFAVDSSAEYVGAYNAPRHPPSI